MVLIVAAIACLVLSPAISPWAMGVPLSGRQHICLPRLCPVSPKALITIVLIIEATSKVSNLNQAPTQEWETG
jgi:hypothetical protein